MDRVRALKGTAIVTFALCSQGCGASDPNAVPAVPASGTVTYQGKPVDSGDIQFIPKKGRPAVGKIESGRFQMTTYSEGDGAVPGKVAVSILSVQEVPSKKGRDPEVRYLIPEKYASPNNSGLEIEIPPDGNREIKIDLP